MFLQLDTELKANILEKQFKINSLLLSYSLFVELYVASF